MTLSDLVTTCRGAGIQLTPNGDHLRVAAPQGRLTTELRNALATRKPELLAVLARLEGMRRTLGQVPIPCALREAKGGPGRCFSCGDALAHPATYGRCGPCDIAAESFYRECPEAAERWEMPAPSEQA